MLNKNNKILSMIEIVEKVSRRSNHTATCCHSTDVILDKITTNMIIESVEHQHVLIRESNILYLIIIIMISIKIKSH